MPCGSRLLRKKAQKSVLCQSQAATIVLAEQARVKERYNLSYSELQGLLAREREREEHGGTERRTGDRRTVRDKQRDGRTEIQTDRDRQMTDGRTDRRTER